MKSHRMLSPIALIVMASTLALIGCREDIEPFEVGNPSSERRVLVAAEQTTFKEAVVNRVLEDVGTDDIYFNVVGLDALEEEEAAHYGAVLLVCWYSGGRVDRRATGFIRDTRRRDRDRIIVFYTAGAESPLPEAARRELHDVDAIGSVSRRAKIEQSAQEIAARINSKL